VLDIVSESIKTEGRSTAQESALFRYSEETEPIRAAGQRVASRVGQIGEHEKSSDSLFADLLLAQPPDSELFALFVPIHAVHSNERAEEIAQDILPNHPVENLGQIVTGVDECMERIAPPAGVGSVITALAGHNRHARHGIVQLERIAGDIVDLEFAVGGLL